MKILIAEVEMNKWKTVYNITLNSELEKISDADKEHCVLSEITQIIQLVF